VETYLYTLELDSHGRIIGGQWLVENNHSYISLADAYNWLITADQNNDGVNDYSEEEAISIIWDNFRFPDYLWLQKDVGFPEEFVPLSSYYDLITTTTTSRQKLYDYFGEIERIYEASLE
jgi:hypothetical protein